MAVNGRLCPRVEHACGTDEGARVWDAVQRAGAWSGGGMTPRRIDRQAVRARLDPMPAWIIEALLDAFEPAALNAAVVGDKRRRANDRRANGVREDKDDKDD